MKYKLQALDEGNITFLKADRSAAHKKFDFVIGLAFWLSVVVIGYFAVIVTAHYIGTIHLS